MNMAHFLETQTPSILKIRALIVTLALANYVIPLTSVVVDFLPSSNEETVCGLLQEVTNIIKLFDYIGPVAPEE